MNSVSAGDFASFVSLTRHRCLEEPEAIAYRFLSFGERGTQLLTRSELDLRARTIGAWLQQQQLSGERILLLYPPGLDFIAAVFGCLYAGAVATPAYPPHPAQWNRTVPRLMAIMEDARPAAVLAPAELIHAVERLPVGAEQMRRIRWSPLPLNLDALADQWKPAEARLSDLAVLQYTSGSTAAPKGVMISHANLLDNSKRIKHAFRIRQDACGVSWLPPFHDMGLIGGLFQPIYSGLTVHLMSPLAFLQRPARWLQAISDCRAQLSGGPNFAYDLCVRRVSDEDKRGLDLSCWKVAFNGAEPVQRKTLERFSEAFRECGFRTEAFHCCYGLAEATLLVSGGRETASCRTLSLERKAMDANHVVYADQSDPRDVCTVVGCGAALDNVTIVAPESLTGCAEREIGEIWVSGASVAQGYWSGNSETPSTFEAYRSDTGEGPFLRTGDLGFIANGELFVTGRLKDLIIIAGRNHYPNDIEMTVESAHASIRPSCCAAFSVVADEEERLVVVAELARRPAGGTLDRLEVTRAITRAVAEVHELQIHTLLLLKAGALPKTSSGKIQRRECRRVFLRDEFQRVGD